MIVASRNADLGAGVCGGAARARLRRRDDRGRRLGLASRSGHPLVKADGTKPDARAQFPGPRASVRGRGPEPQPAPADHELQGRDPHPRRLGDGLQHRADRAPRPARRRRGSFRSSTASSRRSATATCAPIVCVPSTEGDHQAHPRRRRRPLADLVRPRPRARDSLGLERLPAFLLLRQDTQLVSAAQGWSPTEWQKIADEIARKEHWTTPLVTRRGDPAPTPGWPVAS